MYIQRFMWTIMIILSSQPCPSKHEEERAMVMMMMQRRCAAVFPLLGVARRSFATQHRSVQIPAADGVPLHALVPETTNGGGADKSKHAVPVLCLPSSFGSVTENFRLQYEALGDKYTFIGVDPRGYGKSRPPERDFPGNYFERDAEDVVHMLDALGYDKVIAVTC
jgi:pimeloyl-ACP methyl ester carboxylesterase